MRKIAILAQILFYLITAQGQYALNLTGKLTEEVKLSDRYSIPKETQIKLLSLTYVDKNPTIDILYDNNKFSIPFIELKKIEIKASKLDEFWLVKSLKGEVFDNLAKNGFQPAFRKDLADDAVEFLKFLDSKNYLFQDKYLESYLSQLIFKMLPNISILYRTNNIIPKIIKDPFPQAQVTSNGIIYISTGLLCTLDTEEELTAVLAHEISHYFLDHTVINYNKAVQRQKRAEFWAGIATGIAAAADVYLATQSDNYIPGILTSSVMIGSAVISSEIIDRLGANFSKSQEMEADDCALELLNILGLRKSALGSVFTKIQAFYVKTGNAHLLGENKTHPSLQERINKIGNTETFYDGTFAVTFSTILSFNAWLNYNDLNYDLALDLVGKNIKNNIAIEADYLLCSVIYISKYDSKEKNIEALEFLKKAKNLNILPTNQLDKFEGIIHVRLNNVISAKNSFIAYKSSIENELRLANQHLPCETMDARYYNYLENEFKWVKLMTFKMSVRN